jgi:protein CpxP
MKINKISLAIMAATAVLAITPAVPAQTADTNAPAGGGAARPRGGQMLTVEAIDKVVTLTEAEKPKVKTVVDDFNKALTDARAADQSERRAKMTAARDDMDKKMKEILTPEQYTKFQAMPRRGGGGNRNGGGGAGGAPATPPAN